jgi:hypothetical protein
MATVIWVVIAIVVVGVIALVVVGAGKRRSALLRNRFGPEYDRVLENSDSRREAEADLRAREKQRAQFEVKPLSETSRVRFADEWREVQELFVDQPVEATTAADVLVTDVMEARGYPMQDFDAQAELVSVDHPDTVENYRFAHAVRQRSQTQQATTEDLREALLRYRSLFDELLGPAEETIPDHGGPEVSATAQADDGPMPMGEDDDAATAASDTTYDNQRTGRRGGR